MRWGDSILCAPRLGQCCLYRIQLFTTCLQLDPKQRCVCAIAGFLRQKAAAVSPLSTLCPSHPFSTPSGSGRDAEEG